MAEELPKPTPTGAEAKLTEEVVSVPEAEKVAETEPEHAEPGLVQKPEPEAVTAQEVVGDRNIAESVSFKEESNVVGELPESQKKALEELKQLIQEALVKHEFTTPPPPPPAAKVEEKAAEVKEEGAKEEEKPAPSADQPPSTSVFEDVKAVDENPKAEAPAEGESIVSQEGHAVSGEGKAESTPLPVEIKEEEQVVAEASEPAAPTVVEKVADVVDEDGAKTVEAIEETIVSVTTAHAAVEEPKVEQEPVPPPQPEEVDLWGIPLLQDERTDVILLKFLRARDFKVKDALKMLKDTVRWRKEFGIDALVDEDHGNDWDKVVFTDGVDKEGHPVCYNVFGPFEDKELYQKTFGDEAKRSKFLRWIIQFFEKNVRKLEYSPTGISTLFLVNDFKNSLGLGLGKREVRQATNQALQLFQDNYPEFAAKQVFINVPWWYIAYNRMISPFLTQRTKSKFVFAGPSKTTETLFKYIAPEQVPVEYGGLKKESEQEFTTGDPATEVTIKPAAKHQVEISVSEKCNLVWEVRVLSWDVSFGAEFVPNAENGYTVIIQKNRKIGPADETVISNSFKVGEPGKVVLTFENQTSKKKLLLYRSKTNPTSG